MSKVEVGKQEHLEKALRRLKKKLEYDGVLRAFKERGHYEKPSEKKGVSARALKLLKETDKKEDITWNF